MGKRLNNEHQAQERGSCRDLPPIETPDVPYPPAFTEGDKLFSLQKTIILAPASQQGVPSSHDKETPLTC